MCGRDLAGLHRELHVRAVVEAAVDERDLVTARRHRDVALGADADALVVLVDFNRELRRDRDEAAGDLVAGDRALAGLHADRAPHRAVLAFEHEQMPACRNVVERQRREAGLLAVEHHARAIGRRFDAQLAGRTIGARRSCPAAASSATFGFVASARRLSRRLAERQHAEGEHRAHQQHDRRGGGDDPDLLVRRHAARRSLPARIVGDKGVSTPTAWPVPGGAVAV